MARDLLSNLRSPFRFLLLDQPELRLHRWIAAGVGGTWGLADVALIAFDQPPLAVFGPGGALNALATMLSVMVGVYFGLAGLFAASGTEWLDEEMPGGIENPDNGEPFIRRDFFVTMLVYCASTSTVLVFLLALAPPVLSPLLDLVFVAVSDGSGESAAALVKAIGSAVGSLPLVSVTTHLFLTSLLGARFLERTGS